MPDIGSRCSEIGLERKCWGRVPGFHLSDKKKGIYERWTTGAREGGGGGGVAGRGDALTIFYGKYVLAILKTCSTRLELRNYLRMFTNL